MVVRIMGVTEKGDVRAVHGKDTERAGRSWVLEGAGKGVKQEMKSIREYFGALLDKSGSRRGIQRVIEEKIEEFGIKGSPFHGKDK